MEIFAGHDIRGCLRPGGGHQHILLLKDHAAVRIGDARGTQFPSELVFHISSRPCELAGKREPRFVSNPLVCVYRFDRSHN
jgi:hypothetical protein